MWRTLTGVLVLVAGLSLAQTSGYRSDREYREALRAERDLARLEYVAKWTTGDPRLISLAQEVKVRAERSFAARDYFRAAREAHASLLLFQAARGDYPGGPRGGDRPVPVGPGGGRYPSYRSVEKAMDAVERAEKELAYYRAQDNLVSTLIAEAKARLSVDPEQAHLLARAASHLIAAERGF